MVIQKMDWTASEMRDRIDEAVGRVEIDEAAPAATRDAFVDAVLPVVESWLSEVTAEANRHGSVERESTYRDRLAEAVAYTDCSHERHMTLCAPCAAAAVLAVRDTEMQQLQMVAATCSCGGTYATYEGPEPDCPVHGAVRALNEAQAELSDAKAAIERVRRRAYQLAQQAPDDDWGDTPAETAAADIGRSFLWILDTPTPGDTP